MKPTEKELKAFLEEIEAKGSLGEKGYETMKDLVDAYNYARQLLQEEGMTTERFRSLFYSRLSKTRSGIFTEKLEDAEPATGSASSEAKSPEESGS